LNQVKIHPIANGTVLDRLPAGKAIDILDLLNLRGTEVSLAMNVDSKTIGKKDLIYINGKELSENQIAKIGIIAEGSTMNIIKDNKVVRKESIPLPKKAIGILKCANSQCITNHEPIKTKFDIIKTPLSVKCFYCEGIFNEEEIEKMFL